MAGFDADKAAEGCGAFAASSGGCMTILFILFLLMVAFG